MKRLVGITAVAVLLLVMSMQGSASPLGTAVPDSVAAELTGGCLGYTSYTCSDGACSAKTVYAFGTSLGDPVGTEYCGGMTYCSTYYLGKQACASP